MHWVNGTHSQRHVRWWYAATGAHSHRGYVLPSLWWCLVSWCFWTLISRARDGWCPVPADRFSSNAFYHPNPQKAGCFNFKGGYFMNYDFSKFDAPFFQISKQEALAMGMLALIPWKLMQRKYEASWPAIDPQQRQLLECTYEALENAGIPNQSIAGSKMGVFIAGSSSDYHTATLKDLNQVPMFDATGNHQCIQAGRISYYFDLCGPCCTVDTACSSSLYALHLAVQCIRSGDADSAIVGGCSLHMSPDDSVSMSMLGCVLFPLLTNIAEWNWTV